MITQTLLRNPREESVSLKFIY